MDRIHFPEIKTSRLTLRKLKASDWEAVSYLRTDMEVNKFVQRPSAENKDKALEFISKITSAMDKGDLCYWAITKSGNDQMIGSICLWKFSEDRKYAEVGYDLSPAFHGVGIMDESLKAVLDFGFNKLLLNSLEAYTHKDHEASKKLLIKNGFVQIIGKIDADNPNNQVYEIKKSAVNK